MMAIYPDLMFFILMSVQFAYCSAEQACQDKSVLEHHWQQNPQRLQLVCTIFDFKFEMFIFSPNETEIGGCVNKPQPVCTLYKGIRNDTFSIRLKNCTPPELELDVKVNWGLPEELEGNWTCRSGLHAPKGTCRISTTKVISPNSNPKEPRQDVQDSGSTIAVYVCVVIVVAAVLFTILVFIVLYLIRKRRKCRKKKLKRSTSDIARNVRSRIAESEQSETEETSFTTDPPVQNNDI